MAKYIFNEMPIQEALRYSISHFDARRSKLMACAADYIDDLEARNKELSGIIDMTIKRLESFAMDAGL